ncbi:class I glutamine amidotransferase-like protein [Cercophora scortea]|uniref:Class I glutamine amidotransferase-like protein n=1 Tax=Cercophora scortea TaxID=314031 RepID=A0AAE0M6Q0_9PEZI|nr:class I glutamine amidotransferase-like protein [Cercophora scortea]
MLSTITLFTALTLITSLLTTTATATTIPTSTQTTNPQPPPLSYAILLFRAFDLLDVNGPLSPLQLLAHSYPLTLSLLARTLDPVTTRPASPSMNPHNASFWPSLTPTHTFATAPENLDVLIVPGGLGSRSPDLEPEIAYLRAAFPKVRYLITICTGAGVAARAGVLDGRRATTNKRAWGEITAMGPGVRWVAPARWVVDGHIWSSSGVTAGLDLIYAFIKEMYPDGHELAATIAGGSEYEPHNSTYDPFSSLFNVPTQNQL